VVVFVGLDGEQGLGHEVVRGLPGDLAGRVSRVDRALGAEGGAEAVVVFKQWSVRNVLQFNAIVAVLFIK